MRSGKLTDAASDYIDKCYQVYQNSATNPLESMVVGRLVKRDGASKPINLSQIGHGIDNIERANFGRANNASVGSVLDTQDWTVAMNDAWLMGGIHACHDFYVASPRTAQNVLDPEFGLTVTGRELLGLTTFGYAIHPNTKLGEVYVAGGAAVYAAALPYADEQLISEIDLEPDGDTFYPESDPEDWEEVSREAHDGFTVVRSRRIPR